MKDADCMNIYKAFICKYELSMDTSKDKQKENKMVDFLNPPEKRQ